MNIKSGSAGGGSGSNAAASATGAAVPASADYTGFNSGGNLVGVSAANPLPTSLASLPALVAGSAVIGHVINDASTAVIGHVVVDSATLAAETTKVIGTVNVAAAQTISLAAGAAVIGHVINDASAAVIGHVIADSGSTTAVTGNVTVVQPTGTNLHVVVDTAPSTPVTNVGTFATQSTLAAETTKVIGTVNVAAAQTIAVTQATAANLNATVTQQTLTKGTQGATGVSTQDLKDAGRVLKTYSASAVAGVTTEALVTLTPYADLAAGGTATTFAVTAGKRLRLQTIILTWRNNTAAAGGVTIRLRTLVGTVLVTSPVQASLNATTSLATIGSGFTTTIILPDGLELSGTMQFGLTQLAVGAVVGFDVHVIGYEY